MPFDSVWVQYPGARSGLIGGAVPSPRMADEGVGPPSSGADRGVKPLPQFSAMPRSLLRGSLLGFAEMGLKTT